MELKERYKLDYALYLKYIDGKIAIITECEV